MIDELIKRAQEKGYIPEAKSPQAKTELPILEMPIPQDPTLATSDLQKRILKIVDTKRPGKIEDVIINSSVKMILGMINELRKFQENYGAVCFDGEEIKNIDAFIHLILEYRDI